MREPLFESPLAHVSCVGAVACVAGGLLGAVREQRVCAAMLPDARRARVARASVKLGARCSAFAVLFTGARLALAHAVESRQDTLEGGAAASAPVVGAELARSAAAGALTGAACGAATTPAAISAGGAAALLPLAVRAGLRARAAASGVALGGVLGFGFGALEAARAALAEAAAAEAAAAEAMAATTSIAETAISSSADVATGGSIGEMIERLEAQRGEISRMRKDLDAASGSDPDRPQG